VRARVWGCRGSLPAPAPDTVRYGGNTSCVELCVDDDIALILDAGSGMRPLGRALAGGSRRVIHVLLTHLHLDHLQGLAFFLPFWSDDVELHIWGPPSPRLSLAERVAAYVSPPLFPVSLSDVPSRPYFHDVPDEPWMIGSALVAGYPVVHQGPTMGFRVTADQRTLAYIPDHEPSLGVDLRHLEPDWISGYRVAERADVLLHDAQYSDYEYSTHVGWGHSSIDHAMTFASAAQVDRLVMFHHDPAHNDVELESMRDQASIKTGCDAVPVLAAEGMVIQMGPEGVAIESPALAPSGQPPALPE
jgi:phosphoribosyl 1,2-cyclic phosphodiesterase